MMAWNKERWDRELAIIRRWRSETGGADAFQSSCTDAAREVLEKYTEWDHKTAMRVAMSWHPGKGLGELLPITGIIPLSWPDDPREGSGTAYAFLESHGGKLAGFSKRQVGWAAGTEARTRFLLISAALVMFESEMLHDAVGKADKAAIWCSLYWLARFHGNLERVRTDTVRSRSSAPRNKATKAAISMRDRKRVETEFNKLPLSLRGRTAIGTICGKTQLSRPTVTDHLVALGLREPIKRK